MIPLRRPHVTFYDLFPFIIPAALAMYVYCRNYIYNIVLCLLGKSQYIIFRRKGEQKRRKAKRNTYKKCLEPTNCSQHCQNVLSVNTKKRLAIFFPNPKHPYYARNANRLTTLFGNLMQCFTSCTSVDKLLLSDLWPIMSVLYFTATLVATQMK